VLAFAIVYVVWGSTYLGMRVAIETMPPFLMGGVRFLLAGALLALWVAARERPGWPTRGQWGWAAASGALLMVGGNGGVAWAEARGVPSGVVALLAASLALWMVLLDWLRPGGRRPAPLVWAGLALGLVGVSVLVGPGALAGGRGVDPLGAMCVLGGSLAWAVGSLLSTSARRPPSALAGSALQMGCGGAMLLVLALAHGDFARAAPPSARSVAAVGYLVVFGSLVAFTAYVWLLQHAAPSKVATYAYVNPLVAVGLGAALGGEPLSARVLAAAGVIVGAVALITAGRARRPA
jgi:drug/metabolite transporter (DMT)-like permease